MRPWDEPRIFRIHAVPIPRAEAVHARDPGRPAMKYVSPLVFLLLVVVGVKLSDQVYSWLAYGPERQQVKVLRAQAIDAGAQLVRTRQESDSMRAVLHAEDAALEQELEALRRYDELAHDGSLPPDVYERYRGDLTHYNAHVGERNAKLAAWQEILARNHEAVNRYNMLSDSIHDIATRMGNPYYSIPTPAEAAIEKGVLRPVPEH